MDINSKNFKEQVLSSDLPVLVDFWAEWCVPCKMMSPIIEEIEKEYEGKIKVVKLNVDENQEIAIEYGIMSIPTLALFVKGNIIDEIVGAVPKSVIVKKLQEIVGT